MFPLMILSPLIKMASSVGKGVGSIAEGASKSIGKSVEDEAQRRVNADNGDTTPAINTKGAPVDFNEETPDMFGGLDLAKVKSVLDDDGPMGPPEPEAPTVYKRMIQVLKTMSATLLRMEATMKMLLSIEYERIQAIEIQTTTENLQQQETDSDEEEKKKGFLRRAAGGLVGGVKSAYGAATKTTFRKMLGLTALIVAIKVWREDLEKVVAKILKGLKAAYDYFTAEDFKWSDLWQDLKDTWLPGFKNWIDNFLSMIWTAVKDAVLGRNDTNIQKELVKATVAQQNIGSLIGQESLMDDPDSDIPGVKRKITATDIGTFLNSARAPDKRSLKDAAGQDILSKSQMSSINKEFNDILEGMIRISTASKSRIQWSGIDTDMGDKGILEKIGDADNWRFMLGIGASPVSILNANPIVDGVEMSWDSLKGLNLMEHGGMNLTMSQATRDNITDLLAQKSKAAAVLSTSNVKSNRDETWSFDNALGLNKWLNNLEQDVLDEAAASLIEAESLLGVSGQDFTLANTPTGEYQILPAENTSAQVLQKVADEIANKWTPIKEMSSNTAIDASTKVMSQETTNIPLAAVNGNAAAIQLAYHLNLKGQGVYIT
jgi:hypothetical protein